MARFAEIINGIVSNIIDTNVQAGFDSLLLRECGYMKIPESMPEVESGWSASAYGFTPPPPVPEPEPPTLDELKTAKFAELAAARYAAEIGGVCVGGMTILTDRESQSMITGAALAATLDPSYTCRWKTPQGFVTLDAKTIIGAASAVRAHVQACFDREAELCAAVEAAKTPEEAAAVVW